MIYVIHAEDTPFVKVGLTDGPIAARVRLLQTGCPFKLHPVALRAGSTRVERRWHDALMEDHRIGEWFKWGWRLESLLQSTQGHDLPWCDTCGSRTKPSADGPSVSAGGFGTCSGCGSRHEHDQGCVG